MLDILIFSVFVGLGVSAAYGIADVIAKLESSKMPAKDLLAVSMALSLPLCVLAVIYFDGFSLPKIPDALFALRIIGAGVFYTAAWHFLYAGLEKGKVSLVAPISGLNSILIVVGSAFLFNESLSLLAYAAVVLAIFGTFLASLPEKGLRNLKGILGMVELPYGLGAMVCFALAVLFDVPIVRALGPYWDMLITRTLMVVFLFVMYPGMLSRSKKVAGEFFTPTMISLVVLNMVAGVFYNIGIASGIVSIMAPIASTSPAITAAIGVTALKEKLGKIQIAGIAIIVIAIVLASI